MLASAALSRLRALASAVGLARPAPPSSGRPARARPWRVAAAAVGWATTLLVVWTVVRSWWVDTSTYGFHDWDAESSFRYLTAMTLERYRELPGWNPYACGGYPAWGYVEGGTTLVSPWLPAYLALPLPLAIRVEVLGQALLGAFGAHLLAGAFTKSHAARLLVVGLWAVNGRWALQIASGHTWHLAYGWLPWCLYGYEQVRQRLAPHGEERWTRALQLADRAPAVPPSVLWIGATGACFAMLVYGGGIYPLPHTVLVVGLYALLAALMQRSWRPLGLLALVGLVGLGLAAPKLLPVLHTFAGDPRLIESSERLDLGAFVTLLTSRDQGFFARPARVSPYGWHEWGMYISWAGVALLGLGFVLTEGRREVALKLIGALLVLLGFGAFHPLAPWPLLHEQLPLFRSQHVPSRFLYPAVLVLGLVTAAGLGRIVRRRRRSLPWLDLALAVAVAAVALDVARVAELPMKSAMWMVPSPIPAGRAFQHAAEPPFQYRKRDWAGPVLLAMMGNTGVLNCYGVPRSADRPIAARAPTDDRYQGEAYVVGPAEGGVAAGAGVTIRSWSPNRVELELRDAPAGATLVYNMNHREGWHSDAGPVVSHEGLVAVAVPAGAKSVSFWYRPPGFGTGLLLALGTAVLLALAAAWPLLRERRQEARLLARGRRA